MTIGPEVIELETRIRVNKPGYVPNGKPRGRPKGSVTGKYGPFKSEAIDYYIKKHYPCQSLPWGALTDLSVKFGVSKELVRQRAAKLEYESSTEITHKNLELKKEFSALCLDCRSEPKMPGKKVCENCWFVPIVCFGCNELVKIPRYRFRVRRDNINHGLLSEDSQIFCSRKCSGTYNGKTVGKFNLKKKEEVHENFVD